jgi:hypothetical protein
VPSSTSNSSNRFPQSSTILPLIVAVIISIIILGVVEFRLRSLGLEPDVRDSPELWAAQREMAAKYGDKAIILVGDSRAQLDIDLQTLGDLTGLKPVQLAIDGSFFLPVLADLADDPRITGTIIIDASARKLIPNERRDRSQEWPEFYHEKYRGLFSPAIETKLKGFLQEKSVLYSSMFPLENLWSILTSGNKYSSIYLKTRKDRQRDADYRLVKMPDFYVSRVVRNFGGHQNLKKKSFSSLAEFTSSMEEQIAERYPRNNTTDQQAKNDFEKKLSSINGLIDKIYGRNGRMFFVRFPSDKLVWLLDEHQHPRELYWDTFAHTTRATTIHFQDYPNLKKYSLPDGSHLDQKDKKSFTAALVETLSLHDAKSM